MDPKSLPVTGKDVGDRVRALREARGWTRTQLAEKIYGPDVSRDRYRYVYRWEERGVRPDVETLQKLAQVFAVTIEELAGVLAGQEPPFDAWRQFVSTPRGAAMTPAQRRTLAGIPWRDMEPTVEAYAVLLSGLELARAAG